MPERRSKAPLVWIDCEMTGLDYANDTILSIACFVTDYNLNLMDDDGLDLIIHHDQDTLAQMGEWCTKQHAETGLTTAALESTTTAEEAATALLEYIKKHVSEPRVAMLAGNSVHADQAFLRRAPYDAVIQHLHYRILDVSAIKEAARRWADEDVLKNVPMKKSLHDARADILESIEEARFYRDSVFRRP
ncbi:putative RNA exonuclease Rex2 [Eremomyces bilateralis CBS 781.70]|uniref:RNA exonuclease Rex2 n=1 Tax=Eremomyces bilateralis CBS 781.70 TaxID=1392243 RepID=A0A6G1G4N5_9PEZI|nr:putative RNA exonuclease Rex2 [Eremomyces bilateralis CBS 781.70]KAF1813023.1 putative RNA exonuclease Rex2 [Eremomyces bilateralis CBS 781.70]